MKLLMIFCDSFSWTPGQKSLEGLPDEVPDGNWEKTLVGFIQMEADDCEQLSRTEKYLIKNLKWAARKNETQRILLHSFSHLSPSHAPSEEAQALFESCRQRLTTAGYETGQTPFGYFLNLDIQAPGVSTARIFVEF